MNLQITLHYLPSIAFFVLLKDTETIYINPNDKFLKQTLRNRTFILGPHQTERLIVPVHDANKGLPYKEIKIDYSEKWVANQLKTLQNCYQKSPFFEFFYPYIESCILKKSTFLIDLNVDLLTICLKMIKHKATICQSNENIQPQIVLNYKNPVDFGVNFTFENYTQTFGNNFEANLSILDLLFNKGPESNDIINKSCRI